MAGEAAGVGLVTGGETPGLTVGCGDGVAEALGRGEVGAVGVGTPGNRPSGTSPGFEIGVLPGKAVGETCPAADGAAAGLEMMGAISVAGLCVRTTTVAPSAR